jgi:hypothetical protein
MRDMLLLLPMLKIGPENEIDYAATEANVLVQIALNAEVCQKTVQLGVSAIGHLLAHAAPEIELAEIPGDAIEAIGWLLAEIGDLASTAHCLATACRRYTADYIPGDSGRVPNVKP